MAGRTFGFALQQGVVRLERGLDRRLGAWLRGREGWSVTVVPYIGHGTGERLHVTARVVARRTVARRFTGPAAVLVAGISHYLSAEVAGEPVEITVAGTTVRSTSDVEGYVQATVAVADLAPGWHPVELKPRSGAGVAGRALVVDPQARLGIVSDIDDTVVHTGLTRWREALRTTLLVAAEQRVPIAGVAELYRALVAADSARAPTFFVSTGAWNLHTMLEGFLARHGFPAGPMLMTDWGPGGGWLFREDSIAFKSRTIIALLDEHPHLRWVLVGDSGQHDPEAYAAVARQRPERLHAVYIREVPPQSPSRAARVREIASELARQGVPMLLVTDSTAAAEHAATLGLLTADRVAQVNEAVRRDGLSRRPRPPSAP